MNGADGKPDSTRLYRGTGYSLALGTGTLGMRLEQAGAVGVVSSRTKLSGFTNPFGDANAGGGPRGPGPGAMIKGTEKPEEYVMLSAHCDSWDGGAGATDNGTGTMMAMEARRILKTAYPKP